MPGGDGMSVWGELREALRRRTLPMNSQRLQREIADAIDAFEAAHPLLHECEEPINCHECKEKFPACSYTEDWGEREIMLCNSDGEIDDHEFVPICPACAGATP